MHYQVENSRSLGYYAMWAADDVDASECHRAALMAKAFSSDAVAKVGETSQKFQVHGGVGVTWEHPIGLYYKRCLSMQSAFGDAREHSKDLASVILGEDPTGPLSAICGPAIPISPELEIWQVGLVQVLRIGAQARNAMNTAVRAAIGSSIAGADAGNPKIGATVITGSGTQLLRGGGPSAMAAGGPRPKPTDDEIRVTASLHQLRPRRVRPSRSSAQPMALRSVAVSSCS